MVRFLARAAAAATIGAIVAIGALVLVFRSAPGVALPLDRPLPSVLSGFYSLERSGDVTFAWTAPNATVRLAGLNRRAVDWRCSVRLRGGRAPGVTQPVVSIDVDGVPAARVTATNVFEDLVVDVPISRDAINESEPGRRGVQDGLTLTITSAPTFVPGPRDRRELGVQVDHIACDPVAGDVALPPRRAWGVAAIAPAAFAVAFVALGSPLWLALLGAIVVAGAQSMAICTGPALYTPYLDRVPWLAVATSIASVLASAASTWRAGRAASPAARFVLAYSAATLYVLLLALLHPSKALVDAVFHAHRLEWVSAGRYLFTQPMPDGVAFPYAIGLYVASVPWMALTGDHVALLRIVVGTAHVVAGLLLYVVITRRWQDRLAGALAVVLWSLVPQWFVVVGNANLTAAFAQSVATATLVVAAILALGPRAYVQLFVLFGLASWAFLSHVGTFPLLLTALVLLAVACRWLGDGAERDAAWRIGIVALTAAIFSVAIYYGQFGEVYKSLDRVIGRATAGSAPAPRLEETAADDSPPVPVGGATPPVTTRVATAADLTLRAVGWPIALLSVVGAWRVLASRSRDRLTLTLLAWTATCAAFVFFGVVGPVEPRFYRYTVEFIGRVVYATWPAGIVLAATGGAWAWRSGPAGRLASGALVGAAAWVGASSWWSWIR